MGKVEHSSSAVFAGRDLRVSIDGKEIVRGVDLEINEGELHAMMGPNGSGKSTLAAALMGHPGYQLSGEIELDGERVDGLEADERARRGMFLGFQYPVAVPGLSVGSFLRAVLEAQHGEKVKVRPFREELNGVLERLELPPDFVGRSLNDGFSGGEKKRMEIVQLLMIRPRFALLDEIDSGLDIDALKLVAAGIREVTARGTAVLLVTHYQRILDHLRPDRVHVFKRGQIVRAGGVELATELEAHGYDWLNPAAPPPASQAVSGVGPVMGA